MRKRGLKFLIKAGISAGILFYLLWSVSLATLWKSFLEADHLYISFSLALYLAGQVLSAYKWGVLAEMLGLRRSFKDLLAYYFIGMYFNLFMLGSIGGDIGRVYLLAGREQSRMRAAYSIFAERFTGGMALSVIASLALLSPAGRMLPDPFRLLIILGTALLWIGVFLLPHLIGLLPWLGRVVERINLADYDVFWRERRRTTWVLGLSFLFQGINVLVVALVGLALGLRVPLLAYFFIVPMVDVISAIPVSISGLGVREGSYVFFLHMFGVGTAQGLTFSLLLLAVIMISSLIGGGVYLWTDYPIQLKRRRADLPSSVQ